jgi:transcriptional regulator with XRE-family HTH domain
MGKTAIKHDGARLRECREAKGWSTQTVGDKVGVTAQTVRNHEGGACRASRSVLWSYAQIYGRPVAFFLRIRSTLQAKRRPQAAATGGG